ncbi:amino acid decarboxylase [Tetragenococcus koreensis]|uniref:Prenylated flavin chaperone LpdD-like domain-containing protein n=1 Tax=Tetragenococcus koreensis TaxID=290335 RepID=A0AAN4UDE3_9ENTE|nr:amino acid decarboxylase [Tetragenococcus koreensis]MCF1585866.1 amino acid decarboxylase [Tetragenococcus koreensis]MCF1615436.1 amino acid decarboxylase [Tetragenococcus koreensis]MCF1617327.1 amino acid decarboxylase [Tetragenococcus koreensis]MCF1619173.1 amino acid decarboxylase [Tetragenococcus koreensis]MCF1622722.1 amino acid decarboxylase [Tetragenococcus koreensis]
MTAKSFQITAADFTMTSEVKIIGKDLLITVTGGNTPHIGTVTTITKETTCQTIRFPSHDGRFHKDDVLAETIARVIQPDLPGNCTITAGVHVNGISQEQIEASFTMAEKLGEKLRNWLQETSFDVAEPIYKKIK